jgi:hypothetical protein
MKRLGGVVILMAVLLLPSASAQVPTHVKEERSFFASWMVPTREKGHFIWLGIDFEQNVERAAAHDGIAVGALRGTCKKRADGGISCSGRGRGIYPFEGDFEFAPDGSSASVDFKMKGKRYAAELTATDPVPGWYSAYEACFAFSSDGAEEEGEGFGGGISHPATAVGVHTDRKVEGRDAFSYIDSGVMVSECDPFWLKRDGNHYRLSIPAPGSTTRKAWH